MGGLKEMDYGVDRGEAFDLGKRSFRSQDNQLDMR